MFIPATLTEALIETGVFEVLLKVAMSPVPGHPPVPVPPDQLAHVDQRPSPPPFVQVAVAPWMFEPPIKNTKPRAKKTRGNALGLVFKLNFLIFDFID